MRRTREVIISFGMILLLIASASAVEPPKLPMVVIGDVYIDGIPAPIGTVVTAHGTNVYSGSATLITTQIGKFGGYGAFDPKIEIQGTKNNPMSGDTPISFSVNEYESTLIKIKGVDNSGTEIPYIPGQCIELEIYALSPPPSPPGSDVEPPEFEPEIITPTPTPTQMIQEPTPTPTVIPTPPPCPPEPVYHFPTSVIRDTQIVEPTCPGVQREAPVGFSVLRVSAWGSGCSFYLNGALLTTSGPEIVRGLPPGEYVVSYRETGYEPRDIPITIAANRYINVEINPTPNPEFVWNREVMSVWYSPIVDYDNMGYINAYSFPYSGGMFIDGVKVDGIICDEPIPVTPGIHTICVVAGDYSNEFIIVAGAGTLTEISGGSPVCGIQCSGGGCASDITCTYTPCPEEMLWHGIFT